VTCDGTSHDILPKKSVTANLTVEEMKINSFVAQNGRVDQFSSRYAKSGNNYVIFQVVNPTKNFVTLVEKDAGNKKFPDTIRTVSTRVAPYGQNTGTNSITTYEVKNLKGVSLQIQQFSDGNNANNEVIGTCDWVVDETFEWGVGSLYSVIVTGDDECTINVVQDSNAATVSILTFIPQYLVITVSEIMVSVTGVEWAYTEAPPSMKAIVNALWVMTTCIGNLIDLIIISIKFSKYQSVEYFIFAGLMAVAAIAFMLLAIFYYEYVPEGAYDEDLDEKSSISSNSSDDEDEKKMKEISKAEEAGINDNNGNENEAFEEESF